MDYQVLTQDEQDDIIVNTMLANERDHFCHTASIQRFESMLTNLEDGQWKQNIQNLHSQTLSRLEEVNSIITALKPQLPDQARIESAKSRIAARDKMTT